jgi:all-trans-retinol 13,14-reductase
MKGRLTREALDAVSAAVPAIVGRIDHVEMSTPVTTRTFTSHPRGETAGLDHSPLRFRLAASPQTRIEGLALAGQDAWLAGVGGAVFGGVSAASWVLRRNLARELLFGS